MNNTKLDCSLNDTTVLRDLILKNPELPVLIFCGEESWNEENSYTQANVNKVEIETLTLYNEQWMTEDDYADQLSDDLSDEEEYVNMSDEKYEKMIDKKVAETEFVKAIVIWVG